MKLASKYPFLNKWTSNMAYISYKIYKIVGCKFKHIYCEKLGNGEHHWIFNWMVAQRLLEEWKVMNVLHTVKWYYFNIILIFCTKYSIFYFFQIMFLYSYLRFLLFDVSKIIVAKEKLKVSFEWIYILRLSFKDLILICISVYVYNFVLIQLYP